MILCSIYILVRWGNERCTGVAPVGLFTFLAILFTSGLDMGLVILPLTEFGTYAGDETYSFANPLAVEFGFWGFFIWSFYFVTSFYFVAIEPKVKIFEIPAVRWTHNAVIIATCAFTAHLFLVNVAWYLPELDSKWHLVFVGLIVVAAVCSSTNIHFVKRLSVTSTGLFFALIGGMWLALGEPLSRLGADIAPLSEYFTNLHRFILPMSDYHAFYLLWWFSWSIMIGQFVARFIGGLRVYQLLLALLIVPSIPLAIWFAVLFRYHTRAEPLGLNWKLVMLSVGVLFVVNSVDSLIRLYSENLGLTVQRLGSLRYVLGHMVLMMGLVGLYQLTPLKIEWIGLVVIGLFATTLGLLVRKRAELPSSLTASATPSTAAVVYGSREG